MSKVSMIGSFTCKPGCGDEMETVLSAMVDAAGEEPGVEVYSYHRGEADTFWFFALMTDQTAMQNHGQSEAMQSAMAAFGPLMSAPPEMSMTTPVAAIGLTL